MTPQIPKRLIMCRFKHFQGSKNPSRHVTRRVERPCSNHFPSNRPSRPQNPDRRKKERKEERKFFSRFYNNLLVIQVTHHFIILFFSEMVFFRSLLRERKKINFFRRIGDEMTRFLKRFAFSRVPQRVDVFSKGRPLRAFLRISPLPSLRIQTRILEFRRALSGPNP